MGLSRNGVFWYRDEIIEEYYSFEDIKRISKKY